MEDPRELLVWWEKYEVCGKMYNEKYQNLGMKQLNNKEDVIKLFLVQLAQLRVFRVDLVQVSKIPSNQELNYFSHISKTISKQRMISF